MQTARILSGQSGPHCGRRCHFSESRTAMRARSARNRQAREGEAPSELVRGWLQKQASFPPQALPSKPVRHSTPAGSSDGASPLRLSASRLKIFAPVFSSVGLPSILRLWSGVLNLRVRCRLPRRSIRVFRRVARFLLASQQLRNPTVQAALSKAADWSLRCDTFGN